MTQEEKEKIQLSIAKFLKWEILPYTNNKCFTKDDTWDISHLDDFNLDDWNFIMEIVDAIEKLRYLVVIQSNFCQIQKVGTKENSFTPYIISSVYGVTKKESIIQAINQFLIFYNNENS